MRSSDLSNLLLLSLGDSGGVAEEGDGGVSTDFIFMGGRSSSFPFKRADMNPADAATNCFLLHREDDKGRPAPPVPGLPALLPLPGTKVAGAVGGRGLADDADV